MHPLCKFGDCRSVACRDKADISIFYDALKPSKVGQVTQFLVSKDCSPVCLSVQDFGSLCPAVMICDTIFNVTDRPALQTDPQTEGFVQSTVLELITCAKRGESVRIISLLQ